MKSSKFFSRSTISALSLATALMESTIIYSVWLTMRWARVQLVVIRLQLGTSKNPSHLWA